MRWDMRRRDAARGTPPVMKQEQAARVASVWMFRCHKAFQGPTLSRNQTDDIISGVVDRVWRG